MRELLIWGIIFSFSLYAMKNWFAPVPVLILMMAKYGDPEMPAKLAGISGFSPWNVLMLSAVIGYIIQKKKDNSHWDMGGGVTILFIIFVSSIIISAVRMMLDQESLMFYGVNETNSELFIEYIFNAIKYLIPGYLVFVGARTAPRRKVILWSIILAHLAIAAITIRNIPLSSVTSGRELTLVGLKVLQIKFSWSKVNTAMLLGCSAWAVLFATNFLFGNKRKYLCLVLFGIMSAALALTGGRMGYAVWGALGVIFAFTRWKKGLIIIPSLVVIILSVVPSISDRVLDGAAKDGDEMDTNTMTSGRTVAWPVVVDRITLAPLFGYGGLAMIRTGATAEVSEINNTPDGERGFPHPHNAYLRIILDSGMIGGLPIIWLFGLILWRSMRLFEKTGSENDAIGITSFCLVLGLCLAGLGSQTFYPVHGAIAMWASVGLVLRVYQDKLNQRK